MSEESPEYKTKAAVKFDYNLMQLGGRLTNNPELRYTPTSTPVCDFQLAVNESRKDANGEWHEETCFIGCVVWGKLAEVCAEYIKKGSPVFLTGRLKLDQWEKDGQKRSKHKVRVDSIKFLAPKEETASAPVPEQGDAYEDDIPY